MEKLELRRRCLQRLDAGPVRLVSWRMVAWPRSSDRTLARSGEWTHRGCVRFRLTYVDVCERAWLETIGCRVVSCHQQFDASGRAILSLDAYWM